MGSERRRRQEGGERGGEGGGGRGLNQIGGVPTTTSGVPIAIGQD